MCTLDFDTWFADHLGERPEEVTCLLEDKTAVRFLIAWSLLEPKCFGGSARGKNLSSHCQRLVDEGFDPGSLSPIIEYFHSRYQCKKLLSNLMRENKKSKSELYTKFESLLEEPVDTLLNCEKVFLIVVVVYRYRNNIFHGSKGVASWLRFEEQIGYCVQIMQSLITHATEKEKLA